MKNGEWREEGLADYYRQMELKAKGNNFYTWCLLNRNKSNPGVKCLEWEQTFNIITRLRFTKTSSSFFVVPSCQLLDLTSTFSQHN